jgi:hypothetical protein
LDGLLEEEIGGALITSVDGEFVGFVVVAGESEGKGLIVGKVTWPGEGKKVKAGAIEPDGAEVVATGPSVGTGISDAGDIVGV